MRMAELSRVSGVTVPTIKYYVREGLLPAGERTAATQATYGDHHVRRLRLIRVLRDEIGMPVDRIRIVVALIDEPPDSLFDALGHAITALPPYADGPPPPATPRAAALLDRLGTTHEPGSSAVVQLERALAAVEAVGFPLDDDRLDHYADHMSAIAQQEVAGLPADPTAALEYAVLGTALYEPVIAALRRIAHQHHARQLLSG